MCGGVHPAVEPLEFNGLESEEPVRAGELTGGIRCATFVLQDEDLLPRKMCKPSVQIVMIEAPADRIVICLNRVPAAVPALVGESRAEPLDRVTHEYEQTLSGVQPASKGGIHGGEK